MNRMGYRERFEATLAHRPVDRVPYDLAGTSLNTIEHESSVEALRRHLGIEGPPAGRYAKFDDRILRALDIDVRRVGDILSPDSPLAGQRSPTEATDCWGVTRVFTGLYWDIRTPPLAGATIEDLDRYRWPRARDIDRRLIERFREEARWLHDETDYVVCAEHPVFGVMELGCWMCGFDDFLLRMAMEPEFVLRFFDIVLAYQREVIDLYYGAVGEYIHFTTSGDDFGTQTGPFISPDMFAELVKPYYAERIAHTKRYTKARYFHHTCGAVFPLIPHLIEAGVDILNPIQPGVRDMEPERLHQAFGDRLTFHGGIDTQDLLPNGSPDDVKREVDRILGIMGDRGGYILSPAHNLQPDVPAANIAAIFQGAEEHYGRRNKAG
jgi:uroporphyrinogen decarboxylase